MLPRVQLPLPVSGGWAPRAGLVLVGGCLGSRACFGRWGGGPAVYTSPGSGSKERKRAGQRQAEGQGDLSRLSARPPPPPQLSASPPLPSVIGAQGKGPCTPSSKKRGFMGSYPGHGHGSTLPHALSSRLFSRPLATVWKYFLTSSNSVLLGGKKKKASFFLFRNMIETHRRQSRGLSGKAPSSFLCAGPAACLRSGLRRRANETLSLSKHLCKGLGRKGLGIPGARRPRWSWRGCGAAALSTLLRGPAQGASRKTGGCLDAPSPAAGATRGRVGSLPPLLPPQPPFLLYGSCLSPARPCYSFPQLLPRKPLLFR